MTGVCPACDGVGGVTTGAGEARCLACQGSGLVDATSNPILTEAPDARVESLTGWWVKQAQIESQRLAPKAVEYGSYDLHLLGSVLGDMLDRDPNPELGIAFYLLGKIARVISAYRDGLRPSDDTWVDISIYAKMVTYLREHEGQWP